MKDMIINLEKLDHYETDVLTKLVIGVKKSIASRGIKFCESTGKPIIDRYAADLDPDEFESLEIDLDIFEIVDDELNHRLTIADRRNR